MTPEQRKIIIDNVAQAEALLKTLSDDLLLAERAGISTEEMRKQEREQRLKINRFKQAYGI